MLKLLFVRILLFITLLILFQQCEGTLTGSGKTGNLYQITGCKKYLQKSSGIDSCFNYSFEETLKIDFCASGNCCPDSNRFLITSTISSDSIIITYADTAANLCRCICNYYIHAEFENLFNESYIVKCIRIDPHTSTTTYLKRVGR
jgi:hypothetical protein